MLTRINEKQLPVLPLFDGLPEKCLAWLAERIHSHTYPANTNLVTADQPGEVVYLIVEGTIKIHIEQTSGADVILAILGPGDTLGEMSLIDSAGRSASALTLEESTLLWMDRLTFQECLQVSPAVAVNLVKIMTVRVRLANELIQSLATLDVFGRVARQLLAFCDRYGQEREAAGVTIPIRLTQGDIADLVGASRKRVNQVMVSLKQQGIIQVDGRYRITVKARDGLRKYC